MPVIAVVLEPVQRDEDRRRGGQPRSISTSQLRVSKQLRAYVSISPANTKSCTIDVSCPRRYAAAIGPLFYHALPTKPVQLEERTSQGVQTCNICSYVALSVELLRVCCIAMYTSCRDARLEPGTED
ncbi:unnamed protein product [Cercospora beticola]|nr:unnamed protein product [Cercospora beticola]